MLSVIVTEAFIETYVLCKISAVQLEYNSRRFHFAHDVQRKLIICSFHVLQPICRKFSMLLKVMNKCSLYYKHIQLLSNYHYLRFIKIYGHINPKVRPDTP